MTGGHISPILVAAEDLGIKVIDTRHEVTTVFAADAVARLSGKNQFRKMYGNFCVIENSFGYPYLAKIIFTITVYFGNM